MSGNGQKNKGAQQTMEQPDQRKANPAETASPQPNPWVIQNPRRGQVVPAGFMPPEGWQLVPWENGTQTLEPLPPEDFDVNKREHVLRRVDESWEYHTPQRDGDPWPSRLLVNRAWRDLFPNVQSWGDDCPVFQVSDEELGVPEGKRGDGEPRFKFEVPEA